MQIQDFSVRSKEVLKDIGDYKILVGFLRKSDDEWAFEANQGARITRKDAQALDAILAELNADAPPATCRTLFCTGDPDLACSCERACKDLLLHRITRTLHDGRCFCEITGPVDRLRKASESVTGSMMTPWGEPSARPALKKVGF